MRSLVLMPIPPDAQMFLSMTKAALALPILAVTAKVKLLKRCWIWILFSACSEAFRLVRLEVVTLCAPSLTTEVEAVTHSSEWLASQRDTQITHPIILTDSMNLLQKVSLEMGCSDCNTTMYSLRLQRLLWICCPGHAGVRGMKRQVDWQAQHTSVCLFVGCLTSQQHASVSQGRICADNFTCCRTEIEAADPTFYLTQSQYTDTGPTSPSPDPITPGAWQGSHWGANFWVTGMTRSRKNPVASGIRTRDLPLSMRTP